MFGNTVPQSVKQSRQVKLNKKVLQSSVMCLDWITVAQSYSIVLNGFMNVEMFCFYFVLHLKYSGGIWDNLSYSSSLY